jgi:hypothetical protein
MTLLDAMPDDQREMLIYRLGAAKVKQIEATIEDGEHELPIVAGGDKIRPQRRMSHPINRFYQACLRAMGRVKSGKQLRNEPPTPARAWLEVNTAMDKGIMTEPTFTHQHVTDTIKFFHGWSAMWAEFNKVQRQTARGRFIMAYKDILAGTVK